MARISPLPHYEVLWKNHERLYTDIFFQGLKQLSKISQLPNDEDAISERLSLTLRKVCFDISKTKESEIRPPDWEKPIQPARMDELKGGNKHPRPDFTCNFINEFAPSDEEWIIPFHVECKRLGNKTSASWDLNKNYVLKGIKRFDCRKHEYGKRAYSGMMVGYIMDMKPKDIQSDVNNFQSQALPNNLPLQFDFSRQSPFKTEQTVNRKMVLPQKFKLIHIWATIR